MNKSIETQTWKLGAVAVILAVILPPLIEFVITAAPSVSSLT